MSKKKEEIIEFHEEDRVATPPTRSGENDDGTEDLIKNLRKSLSDLTKVEKIEEAYGITPSNEKKKRNEEFDEVDILSDEISSPAIRVEYVDFFEDEIFVEEKKKPIVFKAKIHRKRKNEDVSQEEEHIHKRLAEENEYMDNNNR
ncbi:hypothetical protein EDI_120030 [Entamoeba dispar SAW760]|uniref:Uncharacterized protein n=1 Tax=Entamoeba dispar (strain ATCC PRA-260 / SAW760) TaxID=370354 RepID=B0E7G2_ENTDS|nr:uncharacterized protein EDI_120030 [Entamoeba dispar SAW760]EDR29533.1 hypothetical protein EDI_120030 [Entamoeba dispar SAW760]|eukprot:EDR29533.1 hypothetical protein EDI_120030 [Entamoeba dispar SAW760]